MVLVIGGGPCGCSAAWKIAAAGYDVTLVEQREKLGGLASHEKFKGNVAEFGSHVFHTDQSDLLAEVRRIMGAELLEFERQGHIHIKFRGHYFAYPLKGTDLIRNLPLSLSVKAALSFFKSLIWYDLLAKRPMANTEEYLVRKFGEVLYEVFFRDYSRKFWGLPCSELEPSFGQQRIPRSDIFDSAKKVLGTLGLSKVVDSHPLSETVIGKVFYTEKGIGRVFEKIAAEIIRLKGTILTGTGLTRVLVENRKVVAAVLENGSETIEIRPDYVVSTIPLPVLTQCLGSDAPPEVLQAGEKLTYRSIALVSLLVAKQQIRPAYFTYYRNYAFNRLSEPKNHGLKISPEHYTLAITETACNYGDQVYMGDEAFRGAVVDDMIREGLVTRKEIVDSHHYVWRYAYPVYKLGYLDHLQVIKDYIASLGNISCTGRNGDFCYVNTHVAMHMGMASLEHVRERLG